MPIQVHGKTFAHFRQAAKAVARWKGWSIKRASAYVAAVEQKQRAHWKGK